MNISTMNKSVLKTTLAVILLSGAFTVLAEEQSNSGNHNGGLMKQMQNSRFQQQVIDNPEAQKRLREIDLGDTSRQGSN